MTARWFDPVRNTFAGAGGLVRNAGTHVFSRPAPGDWVLLLTRSPV